MTVFVYFRLLRHLWRNREEERELMQNVPGWVVGTYYGEKVYNNPANLFPDRETLKYYYPHHSPNSEARRVKLARGVFSDPPYYLPEVE